MKETLEAFRDSKAVLRSHIYAGFTGLVILILSLCLASCTLLHPPIKAIYEPYKNLDRNPVIVIPAIKGSELKNIEKDRNVWGGWWQFNPSDFDDLELKIGRNGPSDSYEIFNVESNVKATNIFARWQLFGCLREKSEIDIYQDLLDTLIDDGGYKNANVEIVYDEYGNLKEFAQKKDSEILTGANLFVFYYDWRRDNVLNAVNLQRFITEVKKTYFKGKEDVKFNIVAHSMGGLITRFYIGYHSFCKKAAKGDLKVYDKIKEDADKDIPNSIGKVILLGTPRDGSLELLRAFLFGEGMETLCKEDVKKIIITWPAAYQLLPPLCMQVGFDSPDEDMKKRLLDLDNKSACTSPGGRYSILDPGTWDAMQWSAFGTGWDSQNREDKQKFMKKALDRAEEFAKALHKADDVQCISNILKLIGGDCDVTIGKGMLRNNKVILSQKAMEDEIKTIEKPDSDRSGKSYSVPSELKHYFDPGDGKVTRNSMIKGLKNVNAMFFCQKHGKLFKEATLKDNMLYELLLKDNPAYNK
jgi:hypothetical protein